MTTADFRLLRSRLVGVEALEADSRRVFSKHWHDQFGIGLVLRGAQRSVSSRGQVEAGPGDVITCNPGEVHDGTPIGDAGRAWRMLYLEPSLTADFAKDLQEERVGDCEFAMPVVRDASAARLANDLFSALTDDDGGDYRMASEELLLRLLQVLTQRRSGGRPASTSRLIARCRQRIDDSPAARLTLSDLSREVGLSRFQLLRGFVRTTGLTPHAYLIQRRVGLARRLIARKLSLAEAAHASGFSDQSHMTRTFIRVHGYSPGAYAAIM